MTLASINVNKDLTQHQVLCNLLKEKKKHWNQYQCLSNCAPTPPHTKPTLTSYHAVNCPWVKRGVGAQTQTMILTVHVTQRFGVHLLMEHHKVSTIKKMNL